MASVAWEQGPGPQKEVSHPLQGSAWPRWWPTAEGCGNTAPEEMLGEAGWTHNYLKTLQFLLPLKLPDGTWLPRVFSSLINGWGPCKDQAVLCLQLPPSCTRLHLPPCPPLC